MPPIPTGGEKFLSKTRVGQSFRNCDLSIPLTHCAHWEPKPSVDHGQPRNAGVCLLSTAKKKFAGSPNTASH